MAEHLPTLPKNFLKVDLILNKNEIVLKKYRSWRIFDHVDNLKNLTTLVGRLPHKIQRFAPS